MRAEAQPVGTGGPEAEPITVVGLDHVVLRVADPERSLRFYIDILGLEAERVEEWRAGKVPFPSVRLNPDAVIDLDGRRAPDGINVEHFCLEVAPIDLLALSARAT